MNLDDRRGDAAIENLEPPSDRGFDAAEMTIDLGAVVANLAEIRRLAGAARKIIATVKADAYGHGCAAVARTLQAVAVDYVAAGSLADAEAIRGASVATPIILLGGLRPETIERVLRLGLIATLTDIESATALAQAARSPVPAFVKIDCGFGRFGVPLAEAHAFLQRLRTNDRLIVEGIYTHNSFSDVTGLAWAKARLAAFAALVADLERDGSRPRIVQALSSPGVFAGLDDPGNAVATGHMLYGLKPVGPDVASPGDARLRSALSSVRTRLVKVGPRPPADAAASYLSTARGPIGVIPIGLCHAYRPIAPEAFVIVRGRKASILRVCLENTIVDLCGGDAAVGDEAIVLGAGGDAAITLEMLAAWQRTSALGVLTGLGRSLDRRYVGIATEPQK